MWFMNEEICSANDPKFEIFYTKNILLNVGICAWTAIEEQPR